MVDDSDSNVQVAVRLTSGPIVTPQSFPPEDIQNAGAVVIFRGLVRPWELLRPREPVASSETDSDPNQQRITGLEYQVYEPMTSRELVTLAQTHHSKHGVVAIDVDHSYGFVAAGECSFVLQVAAKHRAEAIRLMDEFIFEMKQNVPIWKVPVFANHCED